MTKRHVSILSALPVAATLSLGSFGPVDYDVIGTDLEPLRSAFNADAGKVRLLMLVAPT
jgi:hypothetical protein